jgi:hypothetical protein
MATTFLAAALFLALHCHSASARQLASSTPPPPSTVFNVGGDSGWTIPSNNQPFFPVFALPGDSLNFTWDNATSPANVYQLPSQAAWTLCDFSGAVLVGAASPVAVPLRGQQLGVAYYASSVGSACQSGQKIAVFINRANVIDTLFLLELQQSLNATKVMDWKFSIAGPCNNWTGVTCGSFGLVASLNLSGLGLTGSIPDEIATLSYITSLDLSNNNFNGNIPSSLGSLRQLQHLDLSGTSMVNPPDTLADLSNLTYLALPSSIGTLSSSLSSSLATLSLSYLSVGSANVSCFSTCPTAPLNTSSPICTSFCSSACTACSAQAPSATKIPSGTPPAAAPTVPSPPASPRPPPPPPPPYIPPPTSNFPLWAVEVIVAVSVVILFLGGGFAFWYFSRRNEGK